MGDGEAFATRLSAKELTALLDRGRPVEYEVGELLMRQGDEGDCVIVVRTGITKIMAADGSGSDRLLAVRGPGELLGEMACIDEGLRSASVVARERVFGVKIARSRFIEYLDGHPRAAREVARQVAQRLRRAEVQATAMTSESVDVRVLQALANMIGFFGGAPASNRGEIPLNQCELAQLAAASHVATHRSLRRLRERKLLTTRYGRLHVPCAACLRRAVESKSITGCGGSPKCDPG